MIKEVGVTCQGGAPYITLDMRDYEGWGGGDRSFCVFLLCVFVMSVFSSFGVCYRRLQVGWSRLIFRSLLPPPTPSPHPPY